MSMTDPIADMLTRIRNANIARHEMVEIPGSHMKWSMAEILKTEGFVRDCEFIEDNKQGIIKIYLKYGPNKERVLTGLKRISRPGLRVYVGRQDIPKVLRGLGIAILSTPKGAARTSRPGVRVWAAKSSATCGSEGELECLELEKSRLRCRPGWR